MFVASFNFFWVFTPKKQERPGRFYLRSVGTTAASPPNPARSGDLIKFLKKNARPIRGRAEARRKKGKIKKSLLLLGNPVLVSFTGERGI